MSSISMDVNENTQFVYSSNSQNILDVNEFCEAVKTKNYKLLDGILPNSHLDLKIQQAIDYTPLTFTLYCNGGVYPDIYCIRKLLAAGCNPNITDRRGNLPLHMAVRNSWVDIVHELIKAGADINVQHVWGRTSLHHSVQWYNLEMLCMLLYYGADTSIECFDNVTPLGLALQLKNEEAARILLNYYDDFSKTTGYDYPYLIVALMNNCAFIFDNNAEIFKIMWSKCDWQTLCNREALLLVEYIRYGEYFPSREWLDCLYLMLDSEIAVKLIESSVEPNYYSSEFCLLKLLLDCVYKKEINCDIRLKLIYLFLSLGCHVCVNDIQMMYLSYGFGDELEAVLQVCTSVSKKWHFKGHLCFIFAIDEDPTLEELIFSFMYYLNLTELMSTSPQKYCHIINSFKYFSLSSEMKKKLIYESCKEYELPNEFIKQIETIPEFPSLLELSRNQAHKFIKQNFTIKYPYHFEDIMKKLNIPKPIRDILRYKTPLY